MTDLSGYQRIGVSARYLRTILEKGVRGNVIKGLAELAKNCDDAYDELETNNLKCSGFIEIGYFPMQNVQRSSIRAFYVRDYGVGMSYEEAKKAFGPESLGADTSGNRRNGAIGKGAKDALVGMEHRCILTIKNGIPTAILIEDDSDGIPCSKIETGDSTKPLIEEINNKISKTCEPVTLSQDGTITLFKIPDSQPGRHVDKLLVQLAQYYTLRNVLEDPKRTLILINVLTGESLEVKHTPMKGEIIDKQEFSISYKNEVYPVKLTIQKSDIDLSKDQESGYNILIQTERGGIIDNGMFDFEQDPGAKQLFGVLTISNWKTLYRKDQKILTDNREGLDWKHDFNADLKKKVQHFLKPIIDKERQKLGSNPQLNKSLRKKFQDMFAYINKIMSKDSKQGFQPATSIKDPPPKGMEFSQSLITIPYKTTKKIRLYINPFRIPPNSLITLNLEGNGVIINPIINVRTPQVYQTEVPFVDFDIEGVLLNSHSKLKAYFEDIEDEIEIDVVPENILYPTNGFAFVPSKMSIGKGKKREVKIVIDTNLILPGTPIKIRTEDERMKLSEYLITASPPNIGKYLTEEIISVSCNILNVNTKIIATTQTNLNEPREAVCQVKVVEKEPFKQFFRDIILLEKGDPRQRAVMKDGIVYVHVKAPILKKYFGDDQNRLNNNETDAIAMLADTVIQCVTKEWAKWNVENDVLDIINPAHKVEETESERQKLEYEHGAILHEMILKIYGR